MDTATRELVGRRADERCEYCQVRQEHSELRHHVEHIIAKQHGGSDDSDNLAPRRDRWSGHFSFEGVRGSGLTAAGRATVHVLDLNDARWLELRAEIMKRSR